jgi:hypothetical protein
MKHFMMGKKSKEYNGKYKFIRESTTFNFIFKFTNMKKCQVCWGISVIPALERLKQEDVS